MPPSVLVLLLLMSLLLLRADADMWVVLIVVPHLRDGVELAVPRLS